MTITTLINAQSFGTSTNVGNNKFAPSPTTLQSTTTAYVINVKLVGAQPENNIKVKVWYTTCFESTTAANAPMQLAGTARFVEGKMSSDGNTAFTSKTDSSLEPVTGGYLNCWVDAPALGAAATITVTLVELP